MDLVIMPQHWAAILAICIMISGLIIARVKKTLMVFALIFTNIVIFIITSIYYYQTVYGQDYAIPIILKPFSELDYAGLGFRAIYLNPTYSPQLYTLFTNLFVHGDFLHLLGNMIVFFFIGMPFEQRVGWKKFIGIYLLAGVCGTLAHSFLNMGSDTLLIGASGAIFGIMGAFAYSYPRDEVVMPIPLVIVMILRRIKVIYAVALFAVMETIFVYFGGQGNTAHFAHIGGLIGGVILAAILIGKNKTHTKEGKTVYYDSYMANRPRKINFSELERFANTPDLKEILVKIKNETIPQAQDMWLEHFIEKAICPKCKSNLYHFDRKIWCNNCGFQTKY